jgi:outer membrane receptor protein involved in Fe transport
LVSADLRLGYGVRLEGSKSITATIDVFNLFNFQTETAVDQRYTPSPVLPNATRGAPLRNADGTPFSGTVNGNFGKATEYQPPRIFRFGLKATF